jgi:hypothetical protein
MSGSANQENNKLNTCRTLITLHRTYDLVAYLDYDTAAFLGSRLQNMLTGWQYDSIRDIWVMLSRLNQYCLLKNRSELLVVLHRPTGHKLLVPQASWAVLV